MSRQPAAGFVLDTNLVSELHGLRAAPAPMAWLAAQDPVPHRGSEIPAIAVAANVD